MLEEELKFDAGDDFRLPPIPGLRFEGRMKLVASYFDTADLRLARCGASLRHRVGDELPWTVKLPSGTPGVRHEISVAGPRVMPPADLVWLVVSLTRGAALRRVAVLRSDRRVYRVGDVEIADDRVLSGAVAFREIELELKGEDRKSLSILERVLKRAGARPSPYPSKLVRVLGERASRPPDLIPPSARSGTAGRQLVRQAIREDVQRMLRHDPLVRLGEPLPDGDTAVHQMRVGCRRLRSDLRTFAKMLDTDWVGRLRRELGWVADLLGAVRDIEVLRARLRVTADADPLAPMDRAAVAAIDGHLAGRHTLALNGLEEGLRTARYVDLVEALTEATRKQPFTEKKLKVREARGLSARARALTLQDRDEDWHRVRILAKRSRYAAEALGSRSRAGALAAVQDLLGEHQDAAVAARTWLEFASDPALAVTAGRLYERERARIRRVREEFPAVWERVERA